MCLDCLKVVVLILVTEMEDTSTVLNFHKKYNVSYICACMSRMVTY